MSPSSLTIDGVRYEALLTCANLLTSPSIEGFYALRLCLLSPQWPRDVEIYCEFEEPWPRTIEALDGLTLLVPEPEDVSNCIEAALGEPQHYVYVAVRRLPEDEGAGGSYGFCEVTLPMRRAEGGFLIEGAYLFGGEPVAAVAYVEREVALSLFAPTSLFALEAED